MLSAVGALAQRGCVLCQVPFERFMGALYDARGHKMW